MDVGTAFALAAVLVSCGSLLLTVFVLRPMAARARLARRVLSVQNRVVDAMLRGDISRDDQAFHDLITYTQALAYRPERFGYTEALALHTAMRAHGYDGPHEFFDSPTYAHMVPAGRKVMNDADRELNEVVADYLVGGSKFWFVIAPARTAVRRLHKRREARPVSVVTPGDLASDYREASREMNVATLGRGRPLMA